MSVLSSAERFCPMLVLSPGQTPHHLHLMTNHHKNKSSYKEESISCLWDDRRRQSGRASQKAKCGHSPTYCSGKNCTPPPATTQLFREGGFSACLLHCMGQAGCASGEGRRHGMHYHLGGGGKRTFSTSPACHRPHLLLLCLPSRHAFNNL